MDGLLDSLTPLATLLSRSADPTAVSATLTGVLGSGIAIETGEALRSCFGADAGSALAALKAAGISPPCTEWRIRLAQAEVLALELQRNRPFAPCLAMTVPDFLRIAWVEHQSEFPAADWPRETWPAILDIASHAQHELLLAAPFLNVQHALAVAPNVARVTAAGGEILVVTQSTRRSGMDQNAAAVRLLRDAAHHPDRVQVWSWAGPGLGIHFKAVAADRQHAYIGSANLTTQAALRQAEIGVILHGSLAHQLDHWIRRIAVQPRYR